MDIYSFEVRGQQIDMTFKNGYVAMTFEKDGQSYGHKVKVEKRGVMDIVAISALLITNAVDSLDKLQ